MISLSSVTPKKQGNKENLKRNILGSPGEGELERISWEIGSGVGKKGGQKGRGGEKRREKRTWRNTMVRLTLSLWSWIIKSKFSMRFTKVLSYRGFWDRGRSEVTAHLVFCLLCLLSSLLSLSHLVQISSATAQQFLLKHPLVPNLNLSLCCCPHIRSK